MGRAILLAMIAGFADTVGYLHFNAFAGLMTGNTIFLGIEVATAQFGHAGFHLLIIAVFLLGVILARLLVRTGLPVWGALTVTAALLVVCSFVDAGLGAVLLALAMGIQNSAANRFNGIAMNLVFITGNLQKLGEELVSLIWPTPGAPRQGASIFGGVWLAYAVGAAAGALGVHAMAKPLLIPAAILPFVMLDRRPGSRVGRATS